MQITDLLEENKGENLLDFGVGKYWFALASLVAQMVKNLPTMQETWV